MKKGLLLFGLLLLVFGLSACTSEDTDEVKIYTSLFPVYDVTRSLMTDVDASVIYVLPRGVSAHTFEPTPKTIIDILESDLFIYSSTDLEPWVEGVIENEELNQDNVLGMSDFVTLLAHDEDEVEHDDHDHEDMEYDPHYWSDPNQMIFVVNAIEEKLIEMFPNDKDSIEANASTYRADLVEIDLLYKDLEAHRTIDVIMHGGHNAIEYFIEAYHFRYVNPYEGFSTDAEPTPQAISDMIDLMNQENIQYLFSEKMLSQTVSEAIREQTNASILYIYSMGNVSEDDFNDGITMKDMYYHNLEQYKIGTLYETTD